VSAGAGVTNWFGNIDLEPGVLVEPTTVDEIIEIVRNTERYPGPVRAGGSNHSTTACGVADGGTLVSTRRMTRILHIGQDTVTAEAGALYIDVAAALREYGLQFYVNIELGNLTMGAAACCATKDASMPGEYGQVSSYAIGMKAVTAEGEILAVGEDDSELLQAMRSSYGLLGIVYEVTFRVRPLLPMAVHHDMYTLEGFTKRLPALATREESMMLYIDPFLERVLVEYRRYIPYGLARRATSWQWRMRNFIWAKGAPYTCNMLSTHIRSLPVRYALINGLYRVIYRTSTLLMRGGYTYAPDQTIRYPEQSDASRYTFSIWAFPQERYTQTLREYFRWAQGYLAATGFRPDCLHVGYRIAQDQQALLSYSFDGPVLTIDPVSTGKPGWEDFLVAYNEFCSDHGGSPLLNQTDRLTAAQVKKDFGDRTATFSSLVQRHDPAGRFMTAYFRRLLA
jgi:hypothetical protein